ARKAPGVLGVFSAADLTKAGIGPMRITVVQKNRDGSAAPTPSRPVLAGDEVRFVGEAVAMVVATSVREAKDAAELVAVEYEPLPAVTDPAEALSQGAIALDWEGGNRKAVDAAFAGAVHITKLDLVVNRVSPAPVEPRGAAG